MPILPGIEELCSAYKSATMRARTTFLILNMATLILFIAYFNSDLSWPSLAVSNNKINHNSYFNDELRNWAEDLRHANSLRNKFAIQYNEIGKFDTDIVATIKILSSLKTKDSLYNREPTKIDSHISDTLNIPPLAIQIFIQDLPILGGVGLLILLIWFYYVQRRNTGIVREIKNMLATNKNIDDDNMQKIAYTYYFNSVFNTVNHIDKDYQAPVHVNTRFVFGFLNLAPVLILLTILVQNIRENHFCGQDFQCALERTPDYRANQSVFFHGNLLLAYSNEIPMVAKLVRKHIPTYEYISFVQNDKDMAMKLKAYLVITEIMGAAIFILCIFFTININQLGTREHYYNFQIDAKLQHYIYSKK